MDNDSDIFLNHPLKDDFFNKYELALHYEIFKSWEYSFLFEKIKNSKIIFDIWSHIWFFSLYCLNINSNLQIHSFEASKINFIKSKKVLQNYKNNIVFNNVFADYKNWNKKIYINEEKSMQTSLYTNTFLNNSKKIQNIKSINLINYIKFKNLDYKNSIDIIKIDIEWFEFDLLLNIDEKLFIYTKNLIFEYHISFTENKEKLYLILEKLKKYYKTIKTIKSKYNDKIGIVYCK